MTSLWLLQDHAARLTLPRFSLEFDAEHPAAGLAGITADNHPWQGGRMLGVATDPSSAALVDWHTRGDDLLASYETGPPVAARIDLLWRAARPAADDAWLARVDLLVSIRTEQLDWRHDVRLDSEIPQARMISPPGRMGMAFALPGWTLAVMVHPADLAHWELNVVQGLPQLRHRLFRTASLEKGVILRGRARTWFLPAEVDGAALDGCFADFAGAPPPLD